MNAPDFAAILEPWLAMRVQMLRTKNPQMGGPSPQDRHNAKALTDEALRVKVVSACPESGSHSHDQRGITYGCDLCPTIATLLGFGFNVATAERLDGFDGLGDCYYEGWNDHMDALRTIELAP